LWGELGGERRKIWVFWGLGGRRAGQFPENGIRAARERRGKEGRGGTHD